MNTRTPLITPVLASCGVVVALMQTIIVPMLPELPALTGSSASNVGWMVTATLLSGAVSTPLLGRAGDMYGKRRVLLWSLFSVTIGSLICAVTANLPALVAGRALQGVGLAVMPLGISIMRDELPGEKVTSAVALMSATIGIGAAIGLPIAAVVIQYASWHTMFWVCAIVSLLVLGAVRWIVPESPVRSRGRFDYLGAAGLTAALLCLLLALSKGSDWGFASPLTLGLAGGGLLIALGWGWYELRHDEPLIDLRVSARPTVLMANLAAMFIGFAFYANSLVTAQLVQEPTSTGYGLGLSIVASGLCLLPGGVCMAFLSPVSARISVARGPKTTVALAAALIAVGYGVRYFTSHQLWTIILGATIVATGTGLAYSALPMLIMRAIPLSETAAANGLNTLMRMIGQSASSAMSAAVLAHMTFQGRATLGAYLLIFVIAGVAALIALATTLMIPRRVPQPATVPVPLPA
ncbi:MFS transporter [Actinocorallia longicatena]|uniref:MFS transporter n=1 Tax=Actinocorallia longicatena TaxID=111803 RepID=A0ABP6QGJ0_9ACTN